MIDTILFDLDGTVLNTLDDLTDSCNYIMKKYSFAQYTKEQIASFMGNGIRRLMELTVPKTYCDFEKVFEDFKAYYSSHCLIKTCLYPHIEEMFSLLKQKGIKIAIVSNKNNQAVQSLGKKFFPNVLCVGERVEEGIPKKPHPAMVQYALKQLNSNMENTLYVGDTEIDLLTANNCNILCVLCSWGFRPKKQLQKLNSYALIDNPMELFSYIQ